MTGRFLLLTDVDAVHVAGYSGDGQGDRDQRGQVGLHHAARGCRRRGLPRSTGAEKGGFHAIYTLPHSLMGNRQVQTQVLRA